MSDYKKHFKTNLYSNKMFDTNTNIENLLNNTFSIDKRNNNFLNNNESILNNKLNMDRISNRFLNSTSKSTNFNSKFFNTFYHL